MLRRRLLARIGLLIAGFVLGAAGAIIAMQVVLADIDRANADAAFLIDGIQGLATAANAVEAQAASGDGGDASGGSPEEFLRALDRLGEHAIAQQGGDAADAYARVRTATPRFLAAWRVVQTGASESERARASADAQVVSFEMQTAIGVLGQAFRRFVASEQVSVGRSFRAMVLVLAILALVMVNIAAIVLLRTAQLVLRPVSALLAGSRELAAENFAHRVSVEQQDEFAELARAYNHLAAQLQSSEARKTEALRQLAVTLNHGLNNAMGIIEMQLALLDRQAGSGSASGKHLHEIRASLSDMARMVASLRNIRRVVLTEYGPGQMMVDLERSTTEEPAGTHVAPHPAKPA